MDLNQTISNFKGGTSIVNNVAGNTAQMTAMTSSMGGFGSKLPSMGSALEKINELTALAQAKSQELIAKLPLALPAMKAVLVLEKKAEMAGGGMASSAGSASFDTYFSVMPDIDKQVADLKASMTATMNQMTATAKTIPGVAGADPSAVLTSLAGSIPESTIPDPADPTKTITNPAFTQYKTDNAAALAAIEGNNTELTNSASSGTAAIAAKAALAESTFKSGMDNLKALSFASFCASPQPAAVKKVVDRLVVPSAIPSKIELDMPTASAAKWVSAQDETKPGPNLSSGETAAKAVTPSETISTPPPCTPAQLAAIKNQSLAAQTIKNEKAKEALASAKAWESWRESSGYNVLSNNKNRSPEDMAAFEKAKADSKSLPAWTNGISNKEAYVAAEKEYTRLVDIYKYMLNTGPWPGNPDGPW